MKKNELLKYLDKKLDNKKDYAYLVIDLRHWKKHTPDIYESWSID